MQSSTNTSEETQADDEMFLLNNYLQTKTSPTELCQRLLNRMDNLLSFLLCHVCQKKKEVWLKEKTTLEDKSTFLPDEECQTCSKIRFLLIMADVRAYEFITGNKQDTE